ncbi:MAG TPA: LytTR family DNA-binding domain-containing protein [Bacteroidota bacterium]|nr:LytTR family DNA-binding domain-containing protein [Bacteroidota bacterium]
MVDTKKIRALIVDDEPPARNKIRELLKTEMDVEIVDECTNGAEAVQSIASLTPDLVFLDIQMPELDGFGVIETIGPERFPAVIFVTAYDQYAVQAFDVHAIDYLLKPFDRQRFQTALNRVREHLEPGRRNEINQQLNSLLRQLKGPKKQADRLVVKSGGRVFFLKNDEIDWIEAAGNYVRLHVGNETHLLRETMNAIQKKLDPAMFIRIHRSTFVNIEKIKELQPWFHGEYVVIMRDGTQLTMSRSYRSNLPDLLGTTL